MTYVAVKVAGALYPQLLSAYNSSGMVIGCVALLALQLTEWGRLRVTPMPLICVSAYCCVCVLILVYIYRCVPYRMSSFHTPDGYCAPLALCISLHFSAFVGYSVPNLLLIQYLICYRYWADDCPPNFNVYRSSRLKHFEVPMHYQCKSTCLLGTKVLACQLNSICLLVQKYLLTSTNLQK